MELSIVALFLSGVALGMNIWALSIAIKHLVWKDGKNAGNRKHPPGVRDQEVIRLASRNDASKENRENLSELLNSILKSQMSAGNLQQQSCPTEHTPSPDKGFLPGKPDQKSDTQPHL